MVEVVGRWKGGVGGLTVTLHQCHYMTDQCCVVTYLARQLDYDLLYGTEDGVSVFPQLLRSSGRFLWGFWSWHTELWSFFGGMTKLFCSLLRSKSNASLIRALWTDMNTGEWIELFASVWRREVVDLYDTFFFFEYLISEDSPLMMMMMNCQSSVHKQQPAVVAAAAVGPVNQAPTARRSRVSVKKSVWIKKLGFGVVTDRKGSQLVFFALQFVTLRTTIVCTCVSAVGCRILIVLCCIYSLYNDVVWMFFCYVYMCVCGSEACFCSSTVVFSLPSSVQLLWGRCAWQLCVCRAPSRLCGTLLLIWVHGGLTENDFYTVPGLGKGQPCWRTEL